ncbi:gem-associated protein 5 isoform X1 [Osmerus mordax]|uniref:gem-associated protein 5 isoform X1 n=1 Tax=Osmerus mordax TaxID=8014 RepID=UPI00350FFB62
MHERLLPASPNWYCSRCSDTNDKGILGFGAKNTIYLVDVTASSCVVVGELVGHRERVSGISFCHHGDLSHICASTSDDGTVKFWDTDEKVFIKEHKSHQNTITALHWSPVDKNLVVSGDEKGIVVCYWYNTGDTSSFFPEPRNIFSLSCSPHTWNILAVGYKDGMIVLVDVTKKGEVVHRLRGHDDEIHALSWAPTPNEEGLHSRPDDITESTNGVSEGTEKGGYLASGSKDQTVRIWSTAKGKAVMTLKLPFLKRRGSGVDPGVKERLWLTVHWPRSKPTQLLSSCFGGELVLWELARVGKQRWSLLGGSEGQNHSRIVFNMSSVLLPDGRELLLSTSMDREVKCWDLSSLDCCWTLPTLGGFVYCLAFSPVATGSLGLGVGDSMVRVWGTLGLQNRYDTKTFWQGIKSKVTALSWHPAREGSLAFGTDDGKVGIYDAFSNKPPQISSSYHRKTVYTLAWGPPVPPMSFGGPGECAVHSLYSCAGEGVILQHDPRRLAAEASDIDTLIRDTNNIKHKLSPHTDLSWKPDGRVVAIGNEDGSIEVYQAPSLKLLCSIQQHHKIINVLRWHHQHAAPELQHLLASGSSNAVVYVHDLSAVIENPPDSPAVMTEAYRSLAGHTAKITSLAWSPHHDARLVTVSYDSTAQVWDVLKEEGVCNYRGHRGRLLCVQWSPVEPDVVWTGGDDFTVQEWNVSKQEHARPPKGKKTLELREKSKAKAKKKKKAPGRGVARAEEAPSPSLRGEGDKGGAGAPVAGEGPSEEDEEEGSEATSTSSSTVTARPPSLSVERPAVEKQPCGGKTFASIKRDLKKEKAEPSSSLKKRKPRSMLPLSTSMDHRPREDLQQDILTLATARHQGPPAHCVPGQGEHIQLGLFADRQALSRMFQEEEEGHLEAGHYDCVVYLRLWSGDITGALQVATEKGELNDHLLSVAPMAGYQVWCRTVEAYVKQLCQQESYQKAASHLLSIHKVYPAIELLRDHQLYREAIALAKARLQEDDPVLKTLYTFWAGQLEKDGHLATAAKCYLAAGSPFDAAKVIAKKNDVGSLKTAAALAGVAGEAELSRSLALRCAKDLAHAHDWPGAQQVLATHHSLLAHRLHFCTTEMLSACLSGVDGVPQASLPSHPWASPVLGEAGLLGGVREVWGREFGVGEGDQEKLQGLQQVLRAVESPLPSPNIPLKQLLNHLSLDLTLAALSWLLGDQGAAVEGMWRGVAKAREAGLFSLVAETCSLLFPRGVGSVRGFSSSLEPGQEPGWLSSKSLEAFVSYYWLYGLWWALSAKRRAVGESQGPDGPRSLAEIRNGSATPEMQNGEKEEEKEEVPVVKQNGLAEPAGVCASATPGVCVTTRPPQQQEGAEGRCRAACDLLLSEPHAMHQASQRAIAEIQLRLASMVHQHSRAQETEPPAGEGQASPPSSTTTQEPTQPDSQESTAAPQCAGGDTLPSLVAMVSQHHKELEGLPDDVKKSEHPDVMESCLVILYLSQSCSLVGAANQTLARDLLAKHGTTSDLRKAAQRFLS